MTPRKFLAALALGLPVSVLAHSAVFGSEHALGGTSHGLLLDATLAAVCATIAALVFGAVLFASGGRQGSIVACRLRELLPGGPAVFAAAAGWFGLIERAEGAHGISLLSVALALALATTVAGALLRAGVRALAQLVVRVCHAAFDKQITPFVHHGKSIAAPLPQILVDRTLFSRPPPVFS